MGGWLGGEGKGKVFVLWGIELADFFSGGGWGGLERYFELLKESRVRGYLFEQQNYVPKE